mmetsp:Transcript_31458/g.72975  ORF Transcript_31458/g.72975 Transcript_31458/m.72975 type:complete len:235 (-) Transcript_31458:276-980(-)
MPVQRRGHKVCGQDTLRLQCSGSEHFADLVGHEAVSANADGQPLSAVVHKGIAATDLADDAPALRTRVCRFRNSEVGKVAVAFEAAQRAPQQLQFFTLQPHCPQACQVLQFARALRPQVLRMFTAQTLQRASHSLRRGPGRTIAGQHIEIGARASLPACAEVPRHFGCAMEHNVGRKETVDTLYDPVYVVIIDHEPRGHDIAHGTNTRVGAACSSPAYPLDVAKIGGQDGAGAE